MDTLKTKYSINIIVSLIREHEYETLQIQDLPTKAQAREIQFIKFPIVDGSIPNSLENTFQIVKDIVNYLIKGKNVMINCMGGLIWNILDIFVGDFLFLGLGRTGLIASCVLLHLYSTLKLSITPTEAIQTVRKARKGAVENFQQVQFVSQFASFLSTKSD